MFFHKHTFLFLFLFLPFLLSSQRPLIRSEIKKHRLKYFEETNLAGKPPYVSSREYYDTSGRTVVRTRAMMIKDTLRLDSSVYSYESERQFGLQQFVNGVLIEKSTTSWQNDSCRITESHSSDWRTRARWRSISKFMRTNQGSVTESSSWKNDTLSDQRYSRIYRSGDSLRIWSETVQFYWKGKTRKFTDSSVTHTKDGMVLTENWTDNIRTSVSIENKDGYYGSRDLENGKVVKLYEHFRDTSGKLIKVCHGGRKIKNRCSNYEYEDKWEEGRHCKVMITTDDRKKIINRDLRFLDSRNWITETISYDDEGKIYSHLKYNYEYW